MGSKPMYDAGDFEYSGDHESVFFDCPHSRCNSSIHPGPYDTLGDIVSAAKAHLVKEHNNRD